MAQACHCIRKGIRGSCFGSAVQLQEAFSSQGRQIADKHTKELQFNRRHKTHNGGGCFICIARNMVES